MKQDFSPRSVQSGPLLDFNLLHYRQVEYLEPLLSEASRLDPDIIAFKLRDDGSPDEIQEQVKRLLSKYPSLGAELSPSNQGVLRMVDRCLKEGAAEYNYIGAGDDAACSAGIQYALGLLAPAETPVMVADFYTIHMPSRTAVFVEAMLPTEWLEGAYVPATIMRHYVSDSNRSVYIASHSALAPAKLLLGAGGFSEAMKWHCDWFTFHVAALRGGIRYSPVPIACWRDDAGGYSHAAKSGSKTERDVLQVMLQSLKEPEFSDVREQILSPGMLPMMDDICRQTLRAILSKPQFWCLLRWGHVRNAFHELVSPWLAEERWMGRLLIRLESGTTTSLKEKIRGPFTRFLLRLAGASIGRGVNIGRGFRVREPRGLSIGNDVTIGSGVYLCALHPLSIGDGVVVGDGARLESASNSSVKGVKFFRRKSVVVGQGSRIGSGANIGPGARIAPGESVPPGMRVENVESEPLFHLDDHDAIRVNYDVLRMHYGLNPDGTKTIGR